MKSKNKLGKILLFLSILTIIGFSLLISSTGNLSKEVTVMDQDDILLDGLLDSIRTDRKQAMPVISEYKSNDLSDQELQGLSSLLSPNELVKIKAALNTQSNTPQNEMRIVNIIKEEKTMDNNIKETENKVKLVKDDPISTFSADVDDGSYKLFKRETFNNNTLHSNAVRLEEFVNAFQYESYKKAISQEAPFSTEIKLMKSPWNENYLMLIGVKGYEYNIENLPPVNLTFLVDVSGSMNRHLGVMKTSLKMLVDKLRPTDKISLVTYAGDTRTVLKNTPVFNKEEIKSAIDQLSSGGGTYGSSGILLAYSEAESGFIKDGVNRILLMSDGDFNVGTTGTTSLKALIKEKRKNGITFSTIGIGGSNYQDQEMEQMANVGNGQYTFIGDINDARNVFSKRFISTLKTVAKDVKYQVEFNSDNVKEYRLLGYENRMLRQEDFNNDKIDAGELPSGSTTTAIYEITLSDQKGLFPDKRYSQKEKVLTKEFSDELAYLKIRFKQPEASKSELLTFPITKKILDKDITDDNIFAINVAGFVQLYKNSDYINDDYKYENILNVLGDLKLDREKEDFVTLVDIIKSK